MTPLASGVNESSTSSISVSPVVMSFKSFIPSFVSLVKSISSSSYVLVKLGEGTNAGFAAVFPLIVKEYA